MSVVKEVIDALDEIKILHKLKNDTYANEDNSFLNFDIQEDIIKRFNSDRDKVFASLISLKLARIANILNGANINYESVLDSFNDLATYSLLFKADVMRRKKKK